MRAEDPEDVLQNIDDHIGRFKECESDFGRIGFPRLNSALNWHRRPSSRLRLWRGHRSCLAVLRHPWSEPCDRRTIR